ncbi:MAG: anion permease, partial [Firmicutes bacterium]|nr:anion permease [Bacillota bacterium]
VVIMLTLWILSSWIPALNITVVALIGLALFFIPGWSIMSWKQFERAVSWEAFLLIGTMISLGGAVTSSGLSTWIAETVFPAGLQLSTPLAVAFTALLTFLLLIPIPVAPALVTFMAAPMVMFSAALGVSPYLLLITLGLCACNCYLLPLDTVPLMTFSTGSYKMFDMPKSTALIQLIFIPVISIWVPVAAKILGIA